MHTDDTVGTLMKVNSRFPPAKLSERTDFWFKQYPEACVEPGSRL